MLRKPAQAGFFYPATKNECLELLEKCMPQEEAKSLPENITAGIVPHAGWVFSGATAGKVYSAISQQKKPKTFLIFGAVHSPYINAAAIWDKGEWETPLGRIKIDEDLAKSILKETSEFTESNFRAHFSEHSIEVQIPFIQILFPEAKILPIMVPYFVDACKLGKSIASFANEDIVVLASTDMTHYGERFGFCPVGKGEKALEWVKKENDKKLIDLMLSLQAEKIGKEARENHSACGSGAISACLSYASSTGKTSGTLLEYTTSHDVYPTGKIDSFVGYAGIVI